MANLNLATLFVDVVADRQALQQIDTDINNIGRTSQNSSNSAQGLGGTLKSFGGDVLGQFNMGMAGMAGAAAAFATVMVESTQYTIELGTEILRLSETAGMSTDAFQEWDAIFKQVGWSMEQATGDMAMFQEKMYDASQGVGEGAEWFGKLGIAVTDVNGELRSTDEVLTDTYMALQNVANESERNAIASALLGTTYEETSKILQMTNEELVAMKENINVLMSEGDLKKVEDYNESWNELKAMFSDAATELGTSVLPILVELFDLLVLFEPLIDLLVVAITTCVDACAFLISGISGVLKAMMGDFEGAEESFQRAGDIFMGTAENIDSYVGEHFRATSNSISSEMDKAANSVENSASRINSAMSEIDGQYRNSNFVGSGGTEYGYAPDGSFGAYYGSYANGIDYVHQDMIVQVHQGERIVNAVDNSSAIMDNSEVVSVLYTILGKIDNMPRQMQTLSRMGVM